MASDWTSVAQAVGTIVIGVAGLLISLVGLLISYVAAMMSRPVILISTEGVLGPLDDSVVVKIKNSGSGVALVKSLTWTSPTILGKVFMFPTIPSVRVDGRKHFELEVELLLEQCAMAPHTELNLIVAKKKFMNIVAAAGSEEPGSAAAASAETVAATAADKVWTDFAQKLRAKLQDSTFEIILFRQAHRCCPNSHPRRL